MMKNHPVRFYLLLFGIPALAGTAFLTFSRQWPWLAAWLICANAVAFMVWFYDKSQSQKGGWRVPETCLHVMAAVGATPAAFVGMKFLRHKNLKMHFRVLYTCLFLAQLALAYFFWDK